MLFAEIEKQAEQGVDFMTVHAGINQWSLKAHQKENRLTGIVSRGGAFIKRWMLHTGKENPLYEQFDRLLNICLKHDWEMASDLEQFVMPPIVPRFQNCLC